VSADSAGGDARRYTLAEARAELARRECAAYGHDIEIVSVDGRPVSLVCGRGCGHPGWAVTPADPPAARAAGPVAEHGGGS
jgi:hypothetical protein